LGSLQREQDLDREEARERTDDHGRPFTLLEHARGFAAQPATAIQAWIASSVPNAARKTPGSSPDSIVRGPTNASVGRRGRLTVRMRRAVSNANVFDRRTLETFDS
jgi:hypothetical protein